LVTFISILHFNFSKKEASFLVLCNGFNSRFNLFYIFVNNVRNEESVLESSTIQYKFSRLCELLGHYFDSILDLFIRLIDEFLEILDETESKRWDAIKINSLASNQNPQKYLREGNYFYPYWFMS
jgi:hypothetical protein